MPGPLDGVKILDLTSVGFGPFAAQILGDYGAEIIKIETHRKNVISEATCSMSLRAFENGISEAACSINLSARYTTIAFEIRDLRSRFGIAVRSVESSEHRRTPKLQIQQKTAKKITKGILIRALEAKPR